LIDGDRRCDAGLCQLLLDENCPGNILRAGSAYENGGGANQKELLESHKLIASESIRSFALNKGLCVGRGSARYFDSEPV
jgi:hypothetical protein